MKTPVQAMLWETWRVTRVEAAWKLAFGVAAGLAVLSLSTHMATNETGRTFFAVVALILIVAPNFLGWLSVGRLNNGRPGFPLYLLYTRPVRTAAMVGLPIAYLTIMPAAIYLLSALLLKTFSGYPFPLLPVAAWLAALHLVYLAITFSSRRKVAMVLALGAVSVAWLRFASHRLNSFPDNFDWDDSTKLWPAIFDFPLTDYVFIVSIALAAFAFTVAKVARQRHGDTAAASARTSGAGWPEWLINLFRFPCPSSSATRAQLWFELKSTGLPVLTIGVACAILIPLLIAVTEFINGAIGVDARSLAVFFAMVTPLAVLLLGGNAFGIRQKQGRAYVSAFETTQPYDTAQLAALKILVRSACVLVALIAIGVSILSSLSFLSQRELDTIAGFVAALTGYDQLAVAFVAVIGVVAWVAASAVIAAFQMRNSHVLNLGALLLLLVVIPLAVLSIGRDLPDVGSFGKLLRATSCAAAVPMTFLTVYLFWSGITERLLTLRYVCGAVALSAAFGAAWVTVLHLAGVELAGVSATYAVSMLLPVLLFLTIAVFAPSALGSIRSPIGWPAGFRGKEPVKNDLELTVAMMTAPSSAFAELRNRPRYWFPLSLVVLTAAGVAFWYYSTVDIEWLKDAVLSKNPSFQKLPEAAQVERMSRVSRNDLLVGHLISTLIFVPLFSALQAWYFLLAAKVTKLPQEFSHWLALTCWCSLPALLGSIVTAALLLLADSQQIDRSVLNPLSLNELLFHVGRRDPWYVLLEILTIPAILSWALTIIGVRAWSQRSWAYCAVMFLLPSVVTFGIWASLLPN